jgi:xylulose-5-phosphate/fructose-6-phosphate phosphoketolase
LLHVSARPQPDRFRLAGDKLIEHKRYIAEFGEDMPEIRNWKWGAKK